MRWSGQSGKARHGLAWRGLARGQSPRSRTHETKHGLAGPGLARRGGAWRGAAEHGEGTEFQNLLFFPLHFTRSDQCARENFNSLD